MNNNLLDSTKKAGMHISNIHICFLMFVELWELLRSGAIRRHQDRENMKCEAIRVSLVVIF